ncbi:hypothetical protein LCGC14_0639230 [marine sediment metagenome]|uniref:Uncharacterized protein n=1 Tax=marine sediment metagenome TaxID=412755 RepID=A0A0F9RJ18_9ZZZZ
MTGQMSDEFILNGELFSLVSLKGQGLFRPEDFGIISYSSCTACWRGYIMRYIIIKDQLFLDEMQVNVDKPPKINGIKPQQGDRLFKYYYKNLKLKTTFTGKILLAKDFIQSMYVHMGFQRPMAFETVIEIHVENGEIVSAKDLSKQMEEHRNQDFYKGAQPLSYSQDDIEKWIKQTFSLDYDF